MLRRIWVGSLIYFVVFSVLGIDRYVAHRSAEDLGIFFQTIASAGSGFSNTIEGASHYTVHFSPILYLLAPFVWVTHSAIALVLVQAAVNATIAPALFLIARKRMTEQTAFAVACIGFVYPPLCGLTFTDFHENGLVAAETVWLLWALDARRFGWAALFAALALCTKEDQAIFVGAVALAAAVYFQRTKQPRGVQWGIATFAICVLTFIAYFTIIRPIAGASGGWHPAVFYTHTVPAAQVSLLRNITDRIGYLLLAFAPLLFIPFRSRVLWLAVFPFAEVLLSRAPVTYTMGQHYSAVWIGYVLAAFVCGSAILWTRNDTSWRRLLIGCYVICALVFIVANPLHPKYFLRMPDAPDRQLDAFIASLPQTIEVGTQEEAFTHMGFYPHATIGMEQYPQYAMFDWNYPQSNWVIRDGPRIKSEVQRGRYRIVRNENGIVLYERVGPKPPDAVRINPSW